MIQSIKIQQLSEGGRCELSLNERKARIAKIEKKKEERKEKVSKELINDLETRIVIVFR